MKTHSRHNRDGSFNLIPGPKPKPSQLLAVRDAMVGLMNTLQPYAEACSQCGVLESPTDHDDDCPMVAAIKVMPWLNEKTGLGKDGAA